MDKLNSITIRGKDIESKFEYPNHVLKNKLGIKNQAELSKREYNISAHEMTAILKREYKIKNVDQLNDIHKAIFGHIYSWAGKVRNYDVTKNGHTFFPHSQLNMAGIYANNQIKDLQSKKRPTSKSYAKLLDTLNEMHPFREGNGRSTKCFLQAIAINHHQFLQYDRDESEAVKGLSTGNTNLVAKHMKVTKLQSPTDLTVQLMENEDIENDLAHHKISSISSAKPDTRGQKLASKHANQRNRLVGQTVSKSKIGRNNHKRAKVVAQRERIHR